MKPLTLVAAAILWSTCASSQVKSGTVVVVSYTKDKIIIAADSLATIEDADGRVGRDFHSCKISVLGRRAVFAGVGALGGVDNWSGPEQARLAYQRALLKHNPDFSAQIAYEWATAVKPLLTTSYLRHKSTMDAMLPSGVLGTGVFAGVSRNGELWLARVEFSVKRDPQGDSVGYQAFKSGVDECRPICAVGRTEVPLEFAGRASERAKAEERSWKPPRGAPADVSRVVRLVDLTTTYDKSGEVGGAVDAVVLERNGSLQWFRRKDNCPEQ